MGNSRQHCRINRDSTVGLKATKYIFGDHVFEIIINHFFFLSVPYAYLNSKACWPINMHAATHQQLIQYSNIKGFVILLLTLYHPLVSITLKQS